MSAFGAFLRMKKGDLVWTRHGGTYYLCRVTGKWAHRSGAQYRKVDVANTIPCEFIEVGTVEEVPGKVVNAFRSTSTVQRILGSQLGAREVNPATEVSKAIYNSLTTTSFRYPVGDLCGADFFDLLQPDEAEEIVNLYLQVEQGYLIYSSTAKRATPQFEFVMVHRDTKKKGYVQVKTGKVALDGNEYADPTRTGSAVYLFQTSENYSNTNHKNMYALTREELLRFMRANHRLLPPSILVWWKLCRKGR